MKASNQEVRYDTPPRSLLLLLPINLHAEYLWNLSSNEFDPNSTANPYGAGSPYSPNSVTNEFGVYGNPYSNQSSTNPYATDAPRLYDKEGHYRGKLSTAKACELKGDSVARFIPIIEGHCPSLEMFPITACPPSLTLTY
jgi:hypothetical protein